MKKLSVLVGILLFCSLGASAQLQFGPKLGVGYSHFFVGSDYALPGLAGRASGLIKYSFKQDAKVQPILQLEVGVSAIEGILSYPLDGLDYTNTPNDVQYTVNYLNIPLTSGVRINFRNESSLSIRLGLFLEFGLRGHALLRSTRQAASIFYDPFDRYTPVRNGNSPGDKQIHIFPFRTTQGGFVGAVDYAFNRHWQMSLDFQHMYVGIHGFVGNRDEKKFPTLRPYNVMMGLAYLF